MGVVGSGVMSPSDQRVQRRRWSEGLLYVLCALIYARLELRCWELALNALLPVTSVTRSCDSVRDSAETSNDRAGEQSGSGRGTPFTVTDVTRNSEDN